MFTIFFFLIWYIARGFDGSCGGGSVRSGGGGSERSGSGGSERSGGVCVV